MYCPTCKSHFDNGAFCASDGTALVTEADAGLVGRVVADRYRIVRLVGEGGMGQVYEAQHVNINKRFAIKMLRPEVIGTAQSLQRFRQEAWAASSIGHENIVEIDDFATLPSGQVYLAMELLDGHSLADRLRVAPPLSLEDGLAIVIAVGSGLAAAHEKGIVHRDMKPENVFLARKGGRIVAKILDFGIAKMSSDEPSTLTRTGAIFGTPLYMSPEQAKGKPADARADVYSVGVILYELATGRVPFSGESSVEILSQHIAAPPMPPTQVAPERRIPPALEAVVLRAMEKEPEARFATMAEMVQAMEQAAALLPAPQLLTRGMPMVAAAGARGASSSRGAISRPPSQPPRATVEPTEATEPTQKRRGALYAALALLALVLAGGAAWWAMPRPRAVPAPAPLTPAPVMPSPAPVMPSPAPTPRPPPPPSPPRPKPALPEKEVILDSLPTGAKIVRDGVALAETPEALKLSDKTTVVLKKDGFVDRTVVVDPATRKLVVKLERIVKPKPAGTKVAGTPPSKTPQPLEPYKDAPKPPPPKPPPPPPPKPRDELSARLERQAEKSVPGGHRLGAIYSGAAADEGGRSDWYVQLEAARCYTFVGEGGDGVNKLYLYLWGPAGRRVRDTRLGTPHAQMVFCTAIPGNYHFQAKVDDGHGEYRVGIYTR